MKYFNIIISTLSVIFSFTSCTREYNRQVGCHLDKMAIYGNVIKVETIVQSSMPLTELYANAFDPQYALSSYVGNISIDFDYNGNVKHSAGYGIDGKLLFETSKFTPDNEGNTSPSIPIGPGAKQHIDKIKTISSKDGKVVNIKYFDNNKLIWNQSANYNDDGTIKSITKKYESLSIKTDLITISYADTTTFNYLSYDNMNNWTEVEVVYRGILPKHAHTYKIKRQLTYSDEEEKPSLINNLAQYNRVNPESSSNLDIIHLGNYGTIEIPHYMVLQSNSEIGAVKNQLSNNFGVQFDYLFMSVYDKNDAYSTISVNLTYGNDTEGFDNLSSEELKYDKETDNIIEEQNTLAMAKGGTYVLKWLPYEFTTLSGKRALRTRYYRYGNGSPIPVYCENYSIPMGDGNTMNIIYSFQSNLDYRFRKDFNQSINSIKFK